MPRRVPLHLVDTAPVPAPAGAGRRRAPLRWRPLVSLALLAVFYALPWLRWRGSQALLLDLPARRFDLFGVTLWPQDAWVVVGALAVAAAGLVLLTNLCGRLWCGYACPQTLWSRLFGWIDRITARVVPWPAAARAARHLLWAVVALWTGITFVGFFTPIDMLVATLWQPAWSSWERFWVLFYALATWGNAGFLREQVCRHLCPYARVQAVFCDIDTPRMHYDARRGEPRGPRPAGQGGVIERGRGLLDPVSASDYAFRAAHADIAGPMPHFSADRLGDCVDCAACVRACPMGLDIRSGPQPDCIACGACVDACNQQMRTWRFPQGLIRYESPRRAQQQRRRWWRPRTLAASACLLALLCIGWQWW